VRTIEIIKRAVVLSFILAVASSRAQAQSFNQFVGFGDSTIDSGYFRGLPAGTNPGGGPNFNALWPDALAHGAGKPTTSPGLMNSEALAAMFGLTALPSNQGGTNFATSGAKNVTVNTGATGGFTAAIPTTVQISTYLAGNGGHANSNALYLISSGANDVAHAVGNEGKPPANPTAYVIGAANDLAAAVAGLQAAGGRFIVVPDLPFSFPMNQAADDAATRQAKAANRQARLDYSMALWSGLAARGVNFIPADINAVRLAIQDNPASFGFQFTGSGANQTACSKPNNVDGAWSLLCSSDPKAPSKFVSSDADRTHLFADDTHLTTAGQKIFADYYYSLIVAPSQISFLAEVPLKTRAGVINAIRNQIPLSQDHRGSTGFNGWVTGDLSFLKMDNYPGFPGDPGKPVGVTGGFDFRLANSWLVGAALSVGTTKQSFTTTGNFTQDAIAASLYAAYRDGPFWGDIVATTGTLRSDVNRSVPIGITVQPNSGNTGGNNISLALEGGYKFLSGPFTHGPVVGITLQRVHVNAFTETGSFTSLAFGEQKRNSAVSELGYQASLDAGMFRPFAKAMWNHELANTDRQVTAFLTTITAPGFSLPAVVVGKDWGTASVGTTAKISSDVTGLVAFVGQFAQNSVANYGVQVGLNVALGQSSSANTPVKAQRP
jgi:outer membrane lipase/esterase